MVGVQRSSSQFAVMLDITITPPHVAQNHEVHGREREQECCRNKGADGAAHGLERLEAAVQRMRGPRDAERRENHDARMSERERQAHAERPLAGLHQFARDGVDSGDVVGVDCMAQTETVREQRGTEQQRIVAKRNQRPCPCAQIGRDQNRVQREKARAQRSSRRHESRQSD